MMMNETSWSVGVLIVLPLMILVILGLVALIAYGLRKANPVSRYGWSDRRLIVTWTTVALVVVIVLTAAGFYPWKKEYHQWKPVEGTVAQIDKRLIGNGKSMEDKFVVRFTESGQQYGCDDTRCASVREGDHLSLSCKRAWQFTGTDGYDCRFFALEAAS